MKHLDQKLPALSRALAQRNKSQSVANAVAQKQGGGVSTFQLADNRPEAVAQRELQEMANNNTRAMKLSPFQGKVNFKDSQSATTLQLTKNAEEMPGIDGFRYDDIIDWNGNPGNHNGVEFIVNNNIESMMANLNPHRVYYNPINVGQMTPQARYFMIMHELSHIHYQHPGNSHPESMLNETQADDTALVNAMTHFPVHAPDSIRAIANFFDWMVAQNMLGGESHPLTEHRRLRVEQLYAAIMDNATMRIHIQSNFTPTGTMEQFFLAHGQELLIDPEDIKTFGASNGNFSYIEGVGTTTLRRYLHWVPEFRQRQDEIPGFRFTPTWVIRPATVQNQVKEDIAGAIPQ
jgi:hypothetical protein